MASGATSAAAATRTSPAVTHTSPAQAAAPSPHEPRFDAGRICLDLLATAHPEERLGSIERLRAWCAAAGLVPPDTPLSAAEPSWLAAFRELRLRVDELVRGELDGRYAGGALERVNALARWAPPAPRAVRAEDGTLVRALHDDPGCTALLAAVARDAVELLTDPVARARLRRCEGDNCPLIYLDTSRGRRRRWCSSEACGNRERVARHRRRAALARA
ncbi:CGNR zinc finger domain-containing protein [Streptomyces himalayensis]|uniref:ABATE domain-containing protein n=1 Tax=Streptomyces himalayensis subsp. himalayensis TaxID=2756131 RepID=A0A7W0DQN5_9ACTN|nr:ABATE domain-containing protein [Streptomyces himalayensis]MBA2949478.1 ABATE domain-containing protein [Streptomyces himalayensis subsp. himalayensis]